MKEENKKKGNVPNLRFPQFEGEWKLSKISNILTIGNGRDYKHLKSGEIPVFGTGGYMTSVNEYLIDGETVCIGRKGTINKPFYYSGKLWTVDTLFYTYLYKKALPKFVFYVFQNIDWMRYNEASGVPSLSKKTIEQIEVYIPTQPEQSKIASLLSLLDERIATQNKIIEDLKLLKSTIRHTLFTEIDKSNAETKRIKDILDYEQPTKYIVENTDYQNDISLIPVLTANKTFVLGYTSENYGIYDKGDCIIFDDFTMDLKYVNFPFKVKSSAIKILTSGSNVNIKYVFEYLSFLDLTSSDHKRHYISEVESMPMYIPEVEVQNSLSSLFTALDKKIKMETDYLYLLSTEKRCFLDNLVV